MMKIFSFFAGTGFLDLGFETTRNYTDLIDAITDAMLQVTQKDIRALVCSLLLLYLMTLRNAIAHQKIVDKQPYCLAELLF